MKRLTTEKHITAFRNKLLSLVDDELGDISQALESGESDNESLLWHRFDQLRIIQHVIDHKFTTNDPKLYENTIITLKD